MNRSHRKKPFSNKQKKKQLQEKRAKKNDRQPTRDADEPDNSHYSSDSEEKKPQTEAFEADVKENGHGQDNSKQHDVCKTVRDTKGLAINRYERGMVNIVKKRCCSMNI